MSSTTVPWPGNRGSSMSKPSAASAVATPRIDDGLPVNPCNTTAPHRPELASAMYDHGSAPGKIGVVMAWIMAAGPQTYGSFELSGSAPQSLGRAAARQSGSG